MTEEYKRRKAGNAPKVKKSKEFDYDELNRRLTKKRVLDQVAEMIESQICPTERDSTSNLYRVLVKKLKNKISQMEEDPLVCDVAAKKLARWVEGMMKEAYSIQRLRNIDWSKGKEGCEQKHLIRPTSSSYSSTTYNKETLSEGDKAHQVVVEKVGSEVPLGYTRTGQVFSTKISGKKVVVEEVKNGDKLKALVTREKSSISNPLVREWSTWIVDIAAKTKNWVKWMEDKSETTISKSGSTVVPSNALIDDCDKWSYLMKDNHTESVAWRKRKIDVSKQTPEVSRKGNKTNIHNHNKATKFFSDDKEVSFNKQLFDNVSSNESIWSKRDCMKPQSQDSKKTDSIRTRNTCSSRSKEKFDSLLLPSPPPST